MYSKIGYIEPATRIFQSCSIKDAVMITSLISSYVTFGAHEAALILFVESLWDLTFRPTEFTFSILVKACLEMEKETGEQIHGFIVKSGVDSCPFVGTSLLDFYAVSEDVESMQKVFDGVLYVDIALYNALIGGYSKNRLNEVALGCLNNINFIGLRPNEGTFSSIINACTELKSLSIGAMVHGLVEKTSFRQKLVVNNALIDMYMKFGTVGDACNVFYAMPVRNTIVYNTMIFGHGQNNNFDESMVLYNNMRHEGLSSDLATFVALASSCSGHEWSVLAHAIRYGFGTHTMVENAMLDSLLRSNASKDGMEFFKKLETKTVVSWTTIISGLANTGFNLDSVNLFKTMYCMGIQPNGFTFSSVLKSCSDLADINLGRSIHGAIVKCGSRCAFTTSALIDMYTKCGTLEESNRLFGTIDSDDKNLVHWNAMITGLSRNGYGCEALELYAEMMRQNVVPDCVTFVSLLSACSRCGLLEAGIRLFDEMRYKFGIWPSIEHFACMVDLYGRAGLLDQALDLINSMPLNPDSSIWNIFFGACNIHGNLELAKFAMKMVTGIEANNYQTNVLMCNIFSKSGNWGDAQKARRYGPVKEPGLSWVM
ncbi:hypothetical protein LUZ63_018795 [Rhynchospora breviuscula]|uniref:Pentatricopeptide repeat-containing protein n=1 Tax=Rhynchospora breviuscula TaxID=2022672 RepID=A0A9Q0HJ41_9POAL|nr:hypothetical protein LUZ63_018795 [Rhynchospora breviuscula]